MHRAPLRTLSAGALRRLKSRHPSEIGGILWGKVITDAAGDDSALILDAELIGSQGPLYNSTDADLHALERAISRRTESGLELLGYFRSHIREGLCLSEQDQHLIQRNLQNPKYIFLLVRPFEMGICVAGFFFWQNGVLQTDSSDLEVPFVALDQHPGDNREEVIAPAWNDAKRNRDDSGAVLESLPIEQHLPPDHQPTEPFPQPAKASVPPKKIRFLISLAATIAVAVAAGASAFFAVPALKSHLLAVGDPAPNSEVGLRVLRASDGQLDVMWNRNALERARAQSALLTIIDGPISKGLAIDSNQLRSGTLTYFPNGLDIQFRLEVYLEGGRSVAESVRVLLPEKAAQVRPAFPVENAVRTDREQAEVTRPAAPLPVGSAHRKLASRVQFKPPAYVPPLEIVAANVDQQRLAAPDLRLDTSIAAFAASAPSLSALLSLPELPAHPAKASPAERPVLKAASIYLPPKPLKKVMPDVKRVGGTLASRTGEIEVQVTVDESGHVRNARPVRNGTKASPLLASAATAAARQWIFQPATLHGKPVAADHLIVFDFRSAIQ